MKNIYFSTPQAIVKGKREIMTAHLMADGEKHYLVVENGLMK